MAQNVQVKASTRRTKSGKVVTVRAYDQNRDDVGNLFKEEGRVPVASQPGNFPKGRNTPGSPGVITAETVRQEQEVRAAQIRAQMAKDHLNSLKKQQEEETNVLEPQQMHSIVDQMKYFMEHPDELPEDDSPMPDQAMQSEEGFSPATEQVEDKPSVDGGKKNE